MPDDAWKEGKSGDHSRKKRRGGSGRIHAYFQDAEQKRPDGRYYVDKEHNKLCQDFQGRGCQDPCRHGLSHKCEFCRKPHRTSDCWNKPTDVQNHGGKNKGKGKDKGKARWQSRAW